MMTINNCDSQSALHRQEIYSPQWLILCVMNDAFHVWSCVYSNRPGS